MTIFLSAVTPGSKPTRFAAFVFILFLLFCKVPTLPAAPAATDTLVIHVHPDSGAPVNRESGPNTYYTILSRLAGEISRHYGSGAAHIAVRIHAGNYYLTEPILLQQLKGKTSISIEPYRNDRVLISGAVRLPAATQVTDATLLKRIPVQAGATIYQVRLPAALRDRVRVTQQGREFEFMIDHEPLKITSFPAKEDSWLRISEVTPGTGNQVQVAYSASEAISATADRNVFLFGYWNRDWYGEHQLVSAWDPASKRLTLPNTSRYGYGSGHQFRFYNILEKLDSDGAMYIDFETGILYFRPRGGATEVYLTTGRSSLLVIQHSSNIRVDRLTFSDTYAPAVQIRNSENVELNRCLIRHVITNAVEISGGKNCGMVNSEIANTGASCVVLDGGNRQTLVPSSHYIRNSNLHHFAQIQRVYKPAVMLEGVGQVVSHCRIHQAPHMGIRVNGNNHVIELNEFSYLALESGDVGAIYSGRDWTFRGNVIRNNYFHDLEGSGNLGAVAVYIDDLGSGFHIAGNVFYKCNKAVQLGGGRDNRVDNNLFISCGTAVKIDNRGENTAKKQASPGGSWRMHEKLNAVPIRSDAYRVYPGLASIATQSPLLPLGNKVLNNVSVNSVFWAKKPNDKDYWNDILPEENNISAQGVSFSQPVEKIVTGLNNYAGARNPNFRPVSFHRIGLQPAGN